MTQEKDDRRRQTPITSSQPIILISNGYFLSYQYHNQKRNIKNEVSKSKKKERSNKYIKRREEELNCESEELLY
jgi:hypothetical protein